MIEQCSRAELAVDLAAPSLDLAAKRKAAVNLIALSRARPLDAVFDHLRRDRYGAARAEAASAAHLRDDGLHPRVQRGNHQDHARAVRRPPDADPLGRDA